MRWPQGFDRTSSEDRKSYPHGFSVSQYEAFDSILEELRKMGARNVQVETDAPHKTKHPHQPYKDRDPDDPGVVVYFQRGGMDFAVPCDRWDNLRDNARCIAKYLDAKRALDRYGVGTVESELSTQALPSGDDDVIVAGDGTEFEPHEVLGVSPDADPEVVRAAARSLKKKYHPDNGGDRGEFQDVVEAEEVLLSDG